MLTLDKIYQASHVLRSVIRKTDLIQAPKLCPDCNLFLKTENLQVTGSFKVRGAYYMMSQLTEEEKARGVIACSAGNHAQGVALAAAKNHMKALICLPDGAPISKVEATKSYGAEVCMVKGVYDDAYNKAVELQKEHNYTFVHPFDNENVIAGQGTIGLEILDQMADVDVVIVPIGGGGLISGVAFAIKQLNPNIKVYGVQASGAPSMYESIHNDKITCLDSVSTIADGIAVKAPGDITVPLIQKYADDVVTVNDLEISEAVLLLMERCKQIGLGVTCVCDNLESNHRDFFFGCHIAFLSHMNQWRASRPGIRAALCMSETLTFKQKRTIQNAISGYERSIFTRERFLNHFEQYQTQRSSTQTGPHLSADRVPYRPR